MQQALYDRIGKNYATTRRPDPKIAAVIQSAIGRARTIVNIGAGAGAYEPENLSVVAVEPSRSMIEQRSPGSAPVIQASAEALPFRDAAFDAALALLTMHHWTDWRRGLDEMKRVARRTVIFTFDPEATGNFWLTDSYFPEISALDARHPGMAEVARHLGECTVHSVPIPHDCADGFLAAYWRRPEAYLDSSVRAGISGFALLDQQVVAQGIARLKADLDSGAWEQRFGHLRQLDALDVCYRLLVSNP